MSFLSVIWGLNFIAIKDGFNDFSPMTFNAIRFSISVPFLVVFAWRSHSLRRMEFRDVLYLVGLVGPLLVGLQLFWFLGQDRTTATNAAFLQATAPMWTAIISVLAGMLKISSKLTIGIIGTVVGVGLVMTGQPDAQISLSSENMLGNILNILSAMCFAGATILSKRLVDRYGGIIIGIYTHWVTWVGLLVIASPDLVTLGADDFPLKVFPNLLFSSLLANALGFPLYNYSIKMMGPTRASMYSNFPPIFAAIGGYFLLGESLTGMLVAGGIVTLASVIYVRRHAHSVDPTMPSAIPRFLSRRTRHIAVGDDLQIE
jgi:drug/metabolite transporter (DMT)-like permease